MKNLTREITLEGTFNFRELGGYETTDGKHVKSGVLYRSGNLSRLTERDLVVIKELGIKNICDLRDNDEVSKHPDPDIDGVKWNHISMIDDEGVVKQPGEIDQFVGKLINSKPGELLLNLNREMVANTSGFERVFRVILNDPGEPMLFHCMAGKDRTGAVAALILSALGVSRELIEKDYLYTNESFDEIQKGFYEIGYTMPDFIDKEIVKAMYEARLDYIRAFFEEVEKKYGSVESYLLNGIGLTEQDLNTLRSHLLV